MSGYSKDFRQLIKQFGRITKEFHVDITGKHAEVTLNGSSSTIAITVSKTPSCHRARKNAIADFKKAARKVGLIE